MSMHNSDKIQKQTVNLCPTVVNFSTHLGPYIAAIENRDDKTVPY